MESQSSKKHERSQSQDEEGAHPRKQLKPTPNDKLILTSHPGKSGVDPVPINWGAATPMERGPIIATIWNMNVRNAIGTHQGSYSIYRALAVACGDLDPSQKPNFTNTLPAFTIEPNPAWKDPKKLVSIDPWGHIIQKEYQPFLQEGYDIRPTIAVTKAHIQIPEIKEMIVNGDIKADGKWMLDNGDIKINKVAFDQVWYLPGVAERFGCDEPTLRTVLFQQTAGMYPELVTRPDLKVMLPPIGGQTAYIIGEPADLANPEVELTVRVHDECNGSDVFGSDICTCRPYLVHAIEECVRTVQRGGVGLVVYFRKEGRALGEVTKYLVYNARKRQEGGDNAATYFKCTENIAGVKDSRFQALMPDVLHWFGIKKIHHLVSMSDMKYNAIVKSGIEVLERVPIPPERIPPDAHVEIDAKVHAGYFTQGEIKDESKLKETKGRGYEMIPSEI